MPDVVKSGAIRARNHTLIAATTCGCLAALLSCVGACSLVLDLNPDQCESDQDCERFGQGSACDLASKTCQAPPDSMPAVTEGGPADHADVLGAGTEGGSPAQCLAFEHARLKMLLPDGGLPPLIAVNVESDAGSDVGVGQRDAGSESALDGAPADGASADDAPADGAPADGARLDGAPGDARAVVDAYAVDAWWDDGRAQQDGPTDTWLADGAPVDVVDARSADTGGSDHAPAPPDHAVPEDSSIAADSPDTAEAGLPPDAAGPQLPTKRACGALQAPLYVTGSASIRPLLAAVAQALASQPSVPAPTIVYKEQTSCAAFDAIAHDTPMLDTDDSGASYWDMTEPSADRREKRCDLGPEGTVADIGVSDVFAASCRAFSQGLPGAVLDTLGPVQPLAFAVPDGSSQRTISADAAYMVLGFGSAGAVDPWTDETTIFRWGPVSGAQSVIGAVIGVPGERWHGVQTDGSEAIAQALIAAAGDAHRRESAIGIVSLTSVDRHRGRIRALAFQNRGQACATLPDSRPNSMDRQHVRDGQYPLWGPIHLLSRTALHAHGSSPAVATLVDYLADAQPLPGSGSMIATYVENGFVPQCAMRVTRSGDGASAAYQPTQPCGCYFERVIGTTTACSACSTSSECPPNRPHCSFGYCEP